MEKGSDKAIQNSLSFTEKGIQNSIQQASEIGIQNTIDHGPDVSTKSIQPSLNKLVDQSVQRYTTIDAVDQSVQGSMLHQQDQSMQYA